MLTQPEKRLSTEKMVKPKLDCLMKHVPDKPGAYVFGVHFKRRKFQAFKNDDFLADFESDFDS